MPEITIWWWVIFNAFVLIMLALDLGVFHRKCHVVSVKEALIWSGVWITLALIFNAWLYSVLGPVKGLEFFTGYVVEKSLSVDNVFVFAMLFSYFAVPPLYQHKVLFYGIIGALIMRAAMIALGTVIITHFTWVLYLFGAFLIFTGIKMLLVSGHGFDPKDNPLVKLLRRWMPVSENYDGEKFFTVQNGLRMATPLFVVLVCVEFTDLIFAVDSIPAIFAITTDPFIVYTSNVFAILGLRSLYFALAGVMHMFRYLKTGLGLILTFVGVKMMLGHTPWKLDIVLCLIVIMSILTISIVASIWANAREKAAGQKHLGH